MTAFSFRRVDGIVSLLSDLTVSDETSSVNLVVAPSYAMGHFPLAAFETFCLSLSTVWLRCLSCGSLCADPVFGLSD